MKFIFAFSGLLIALLLFISFRGATVNFDTDSDNGIQFHKGNWEEALALAKQQNKLIFLDVYASWCGPCKKLKINTFADEAVGNYYNQHFINIAIDGETTEGKALMHKFRLGAYPSLLFVDADAQVKLQTGGYQDVKSFLKLGKAALNKP